MQSNTFHVNRGSVRDNLTMVSKLSLAKGAQVSADKMYATANLAGSPPEAVVNMPMAGNMVITVDAEGSGTVVINNPVIVDENFTPVQASKPDDSVATITAVGPGRAELTVDADGVYTVSIGMQPNA